MHILTQKIAEIVGQKPETAKALDFLGLHFDEYTQHTLEEACQAKGLETSKVLQKLKQISEKPMVDEDRFAEFPIDLLVAYLKHSHYLFIKDRIPFIATTIQKLDLEQTELHTELHQVFPLLIQDFIEHVYEEEDEFFSYVLDLHKFLKNKSKMGPAFLAKLEQHALQKFALEHEVHDDALRGLRTMTQNFNTEAIVDLKLKVALSELRQFDLDLEHHAFIENRILFPKALQLEREVHAYISKLIPHN